MGFVQLNTLNIIIICVLFNGDPMTFYDQLMQKPTNPNGFTYFLPLYHMWCERNAWAQI